MRVPNGTRCLYGQDDEKCHRKMMPILGTFFPKIGLTFYDGFAMITLAPHELKLKKSHEKKLRILEKSS